MTIDPRTDPHERKIVPLFPREEQEEAAALSRYWDAALRGQVADGDDLDPKLKAVVQLLRHYHTVTRPPLEQISLRPATCSTPCAYPPRTLHAPTQRGQSRAWLQGHTRHASLAARMAVAFFVLVFVCNTLVSPRSWLLSSASDPDWIPWVSDDWLKGGAQTAYVLDMRLADQVGRGARDHHGT